MELNDAVRRMARHYPGGLVALAGRMGRSHSTLDKEIRGATGFKLGLAEAMEITVLCHDARVPGAMDLLSVMAHAVDHTLLPLPAGADADMTLERLARLMHQCGDMVSTVTKAKADGTVCTNEIKACRAQWSLLVAAGQAVMEGLEANHTATMARWHESEAR